MLFSLTKAKKNYFSSHKLYPKRHAYTWVTFHYICVKWTMYGIPMYCMWSTFPIAWCVIVVIVFSDMFINVWHFKLVCFWLNISKNNEYKSLTTWPLTKSREKTQKPAYNRAFSTNYTFQCNRTSTCVYIRILRRNNRRCMRMRYMCVGWMV